MAWIYKYNVCKIQNTLNYHRWLLTCFEMMSAFEIYHTRLKLVLVFGVATSVTVDISKRRCRKFSKPSTTIIMCTKTLIYTIWNRSCKSGFKKQVPRTGFEPVISALKGRCPRPLDERGLFSRVHLWRYDCTLRVVALSSKTRNVKFF